MQSISGRAHPAFGSTVSSPDTLTRPMSAVEQAFASLLSRTAPLGKDHLAVSLSLRLSFPPSVTNPVPHLRAAWSAARALHPHLGSVLAQSSPDEAALGAVRPLQITIPAFDSEDWLCNTFRTDAKVKSGNDLYEAAGVHKYATCTWIPASSELFLHSSHWRCDGSSMLTVAADLLSVLSQSMAQGSGVFLGPYGATLGNGAIAPSLDWIVGGFVDEASMPAYAKNAADEMIQQMLAGAPSVALPVIEGTDQTAPGNSARAVVKFTPEETKQLLVKCKERGVTLTIATHAALILCTARYPQHPLCKSYSSAFPVDLRSSLPEPYNKPAYSVGLLYCGLPLSVLNVLGDSKSFTQVCDELGSFYRRDRQDWCRDHNGEAVGVARLVAPWIRRNAAALMVEVPPDTPSVRALDFSSLGLVDKRLGREYHVGSQAGDKIVVEDFWLATQVVAKPVQCHGWTFRDDYRLQATWNQSYYGESFMLKFLDEAKQELFRGLDVAHD